MRWTVTLAAALGILFLIWGAIRPPVGQSVVLLLSPVYPSGGTGFQVRTADGFEYLVTNAHVCELADSDKRLYAVTAAGDTHIVSIQYISKVTDLCFLNPLPDLRPLLLAPRMPVEGFVRATGHPRLRRLTDSTGEALQRILVTIAVGPVTPEHPCADSKNHIESDPHLGQVCTVRTKAVQTTVPLEPGSSGSPATNRQGQVIGVFFATGPSQDSYFIPLEDLVSELGYAH